MIDISSKTIYVSSKTIDIGADQINTGDKSKNNARFRSRRKRSH